MTHDNWFARMAQSTARAAGSSLCYRFGSGRAFRDGDDMRKLLPLLAILAVAGTSAASVLSRDRESRIFMIFCAIPSAKKSRSG
jgi:hypothetical protein